MVYNTEYRKSIGSDSAPQEQEETNEPGEDDGHDQRLSEEDLIEMMEFADVRKLGTICFFFAFCSLLYHVLLISEVKTLQTLCKQFHAKDISSVSKVLCVSFLRTKLGIPRDFKKISVA